MQATLPLWRALVLICCYPGGLERALRRPRLVSTLLLSICPGCCCHRPVCHGPSDGVPPESPPTRLPIHRFPGSTAPSSDSRGTRRMRSCTTGASTSVEPTVASCGPTGAEKVAIPTMSSTPSRSRCALAPPNRIRPAAHTPLPLQRLNSIDFDWKNAS